MPNPIPKGKNIYVEFKEFPAFYEMKKPDIYTDFYGIGYVVSGNRRLITSDIVATLREGSIGFTNKHVRHRFTYLTTGIYKRYLLKFKDKMIANLLLDLNIKDINEILKTPVYRFSPEVQAGIEKILYEMLLEFENYGEYSELILEKMLHRLILIIIRESLPNITDDIFIINPNEKIMEAIQYIDVNFEELPTLADAAKRLHFSSSHFSRLFKSTMGVTYSTYLSSVKLQHAVQLLMYSQKSIDEIAIDCGFSSGNYLSNLFKEKYGMRPLAYRKQFHKEYL